MDESAVSRYLERIGARRPRRPDVDALHELQERHVLSVPFENLDYHLGRPVHLDERVLGKIVDERRGGGCYETNPAFARLLRALGFAVRIRAGRVHFPDGPGPPLCHMVLTVQLEQAWLVDVGFGRNSRHPLRFGSRVAQADPHGSYRLVDAADGGVDLTLDEQPLYRVDDRPVTMDDFGPTLWWYRTCPESPFLQDLFCTLPLPQGRVTLKGRKLSVSGPDGRTTAELTDDDAVLRAYREHFGIALDRVPPQPARAASAAGVRVG